MMIFMMMTMVMVISPFIFCDIFRSGIMIMLKTIFMLRILVTMMSMAYDFDNFYDSENDGDNDKSCSYSDYIDQKEPSNCGVD